MTLTLESLEDVSRKVFFNAVESYLTSTSYEVGTKDSILWIVIGFSLRAALLAIFGGKDSKK